MTARDRLLRFVLLPLIVLLFVGAIAVIPFRPRFLQDPVRTFGPPLRAGDRVYLLTGQWSGRLSFSSRNRSRSTNLMVDLWAFDANLAAPLWRKRLQTERDGAMYGRQILGAEGNTMWLLVPRGLMAVSLSTGDILADTALIESRNEALKGLVPKESSYYRFDRGGLRFRAADGRTWRLDPASFAAQPAEKIPNEYVTSQSSKDVAAPSGAGISPAYFTPNATHAFQERGIIIPGRYLGLLNDQEAAYLQEKNTIGGLDYHSRRRLWSARTGEGANFFGKYTTYLDFKPLGEEYLGPGMLSSHAGTGRNTPLILFKPDGFLILHRDRLGEEGRLQLARIAGPDGRTLWKAALPLSVLQSVMPGDKSVVLYGLLYTPPEDDRPRDPHHTAIGMLLSIDLASGQLRYHDQSAVERHPAAVAASGP